MRGSSFAIGVAFMAILIAHPLHVAAQSAQYSGQILPDATVYTGGAFGSSIAMSPSGMYLAIGAPYDNVPWYDNAGSASVFARNGTKWSLTAKVTSPYPNYQAYFGIGVAISDDWLVVSASHDNSHYGTIYFFALQSGQWTFKTSFSGGWESFLGGSLALDGGLLVAAPFNPSGTLLAYTLSDGYWVDGYWVDGYWVDGHYELGWNGYYWVDGHWVDGYWVDSYWVDGHWSYYTTLYGTYSYFWYRNSMAISNSWVLAGSHGENNLQGAAYLWPRNNTYIDQYSVSRLGGDNPQDNALLGYSAAFVSDNTVALGSPGISSILIFAYTVGVGWSQTNVLSVSSAPSLGSSLSSSSGKYLLAGDPTIHKVFMYNILATGLSEPYEVPRPDIASSSVSFGNTIFAQGDELFIADASDSYPSGSVLTFAASDLPSYARVYRNVHGKSSNLGYSVAAESGIAAIAQPTCSEYSQYNLACGKVYLVKTSPNGWNLVQYFQYLGQVPYSYFGTKVLFNNGWLLVTSEALYDPASGVEKSAVYGFRYAPSSGKYVRKFSVTSPLSQSYQHFGSGLAMDGNYTIISSPDASVNDLYERGRVFVLHYPKSINKVSGPRALEITNPNASDEWYFGGSVAAKNGILVVSASSSSGRLYVFSYHGIKSASLIQTISAEVAGYSTLGRSMVFDGSNLFATSYDTSYPPALGAVYHFELDESNQFQQVNRITPYDENPSGYFGVSLAYNAKNNYLVVGASPLWTCPSCTNYQPTSVYVLQNAGGNDWQQKKYSLGAKDGSDTFGVSVATNDAGIIVGAPYDNKNGDNRGAVYFINV